MNRLKPLSIIIALIVLLSGCGVGSKAASAEPLPSEDGATEITIEVDDANGFYQGAAQKFEKSTGIKVNVINHYSDTQSGEAEDFAYLDRIPGELMAGKGADIYADIDLDFTAMGRKGCLCNLADWIAADSDFSDEKYYLNILRSAFDVGNLYSIPLFMVFQAYGAEIEIPELDGKSLNWEEFFELAKGINKNGVFIGLTDYQIFNQRFIDRYDSYIDEKNKTENINTPETIKLLEQCKAWSEQGLCIPNNTDQYEDIFKNALLKEYVSGVSALINLRPQGDFMGGISYSYDIPSDSGKDDKANKLLTVNQICVNAASPNKGTAWKFVKYLLREDIQDTSYLTPLNRSAAESEISRTVTSDMGYSIQDEEAKQAIRDVKAVLDAIKDIPSKSYRLYIVYNVIAQDAKRFFNDEISAKDAAKNMADSVKLYMKEH